MAELGRAERLSHLLPIRMSWHGERKLGHGYGVGPAKRPIVLRRLVETMHGEDVLDRGGQNLFFIARFRFRFPFLLFSFLLEGVVYLSILFHIMETGRKTYW